MTNSLFHSVRAIAGLAILFCLSVSTSGQEKKDAHAFLDKEAAEKELKNFEGVWYLVVRESNGNQYNFRKKGKSLEETCNSPKFIKDKLFFSPKDPAELAEKIELGKNAKYSTIDLVNKDGKRNLGIYKFEGSELVICWNMPGVDARPVEFATKADSKEGTVIIHLVRSEKK